MPQQKNTSSPPPITHDVELPYAVELWNENHSGMEKILARAFSVSLARAIFRSAREENPGRRIVVRHGDRVLDEDNG